MAKIVNIEEFGAAKKTELLIGDEILSFNQRKFCDVLDYIYADSSEKITLKVKRKDEIFDCVIEKISEDTMGLVFEDEAEICAKNCANNCIFCFVNQLPKGMRDTLYVKDDDYRMSFSMGNYVTLTNLTQNDIERIIDYRLSPLYVSVHSTNHQLRLSMLGIKKSLNILDTLKAFTSSGIKVHTQIVLIPGVNDKDELDKTLNDLLQIGNNLQTVAVVPVGLTKFRENLLQLNTVNKEQAKEAISIIDKYYAKRKYFAFASDELYQIAELPIPPYEFYGEFEQIENGVGLIAKFLYEIELGLSNIKKHKSRNVGIITSISGYPTIAKACERIKEKWKKFGFNIFVIENLFFGKTITVTGLLTYSDIYNQLKEKTIKNDFLIISSVMLKEFSNVFLDGKSVNELEENLGKKIVVSGNDGESFIDTIIYAK